MIENYMQLESILLEHGFDYEVFFDESVDAANTMMPPLIFQPMIENAIIHGLMPLNRRGKIVLHFKEKNGLLEATIEDDGIGLGSKRADTKTPRKNDPWGADHPHDASESKNKEKARWCSSCLSRDQG